MSDWSNKQMFFGRVDVQEMEGFRLACSTQFEGRFVSEGDFMSDIQDLSKRTKNVAKQVLSKLQKYGEDGHIEETQISVTNYSVLVQTHVNVNDPDTRENRLRLAWIIKNVQGEIEANETQIADNVASRFVSRLQGEQGCMVV